MYAKVVYDMGWVKEVKKYYPGNYGAPGQKRKKKEKPTPEVIIRQNHSNRVKKIQRLILANFREGDWHLVLKYKKDKRPESIRDAKKILKKFIDAMRETYKKAGRPFKYICVTERGKRGACHHHLIIEDIVDSKLNTKKVVMKLWREGSWAFIPLYEDGEFEDLADYIAKKETKEENEGCSYSRSRNLITPQPQKEIIRHKRWSREPRPEKGWYILPDSVRNGENPVTGYPYQCYMMRRIDTGGIRDE